MFFENGTHIGEMHAHQPTFSSPLGRAGYEAKAIIEIEESQASMLGCSIGVSATNMKSSNKQGYVLASDDCQIITIYFYDNTFYLTTLTA